MSILVALTQTIVFLFASPNLTSSPVPIGTGFIVGIPVTGDKKKVVPVIVTAKHVIGDFKKVYARFNTTSGVQTAVFEYDIDQLKKSNDYWVHADSGVDIAVFRTLNFDKTKFEAIPLELIAKKRDFMDNDIKLTDQVVYPGLLVNFMGQQKNYPIMKEGTIALIPEEKVPLSYMVGSTKIQTQQEIIFLNSISIPGLSGSPVFLWPGPRLVKNAFSVGGGKPLFLGVMHGFYNAIPREVEKIETTDTKWFYRDNSGIALVFPSWRLGEIFEQDNFVKRMNDLTPK